MPNYEWSSYKGYLSYAKKWKWLHKDYIFSMITPKKQGKLNQCRDFVSDVLKNANENAEQKAVCNISLAELIRRVCKKFDIKTGELMLDIRSILYSSQSHYQYHLCKGLFQ